MALGSLKMKQVVEIDDLINYVVELTGKAYEEVESAFFEECYYPESRMSCFGTSTMHDNDWLSVALDKVLALNLISSLYIVEGI